MSTSVVVNTYTYSVTYVADNILKTIKNIIVNSGLDPNNLVDSWASKSLAITTWLTSEHLQRITLEIYTPSNDGLVGRWDIEISYGWNADDGRFYVDTDQVKSAIRKAGVVASSCKYDLILQNKAGRPDVQGWGPVSYRSTDGFVKQSLGGTIAHSGLGASTSYYRRKL